MGETILSVHLSINTSKTVNGVSKVWPQGQMQLVASEFDCAI